MNLKEEYESARGLGVSSPSSVLDDRISFSKEYHNVLRRFVSASHPKRILEGKGGAIVQISNMESRNVGSRERGRLLGYRGIRLCAERAVARASEI